MSTALWFAQEVANAWLKDLMPVGNRGFVKMTDELIQGDTCFGMIDVDEVKTELEKIASERGFDYVFSIEEDYNIDKNWTDHIIYWERRE